MKKTETVNQKQKKKKKKETKMVFYLHRMLLIPKQKVHNEGATNTFQNADHIAQSYSQSE